MGGRAAEALIFDGEVSTGASDDLQRATEIATQMVTRYGMNETIGQRTYAPPPTVPGRNNGESHRGGGSD
jgi:cell division protease FtsH